MRYIPHTDADRQEMLAAIGVDGIDELFAGIPAELMAPADPPFPEKLSEPELLRHVADLAAGNVALGSRPSFLGGGCYRHHIPPLVDALSSRGEFLTAYTPYQAEASQGTLQAIYEYQSMVAALAALPVANASLYDAASGLAEAVLMVRGSLRGARAKGRGSVLVSKGVHPDYRRTLATYLRNLPLELVEVELDASGQTPVEAVREAAGGAIAFAFQSPSYFGTIERGAELCGAAHAGGAEAIQVFSPLASALLAPPGEVGADIAVGEGQCLGSPPNFGGPHLGLFAASASYMRRMPGRIVGKTTDRDGRPGYVLTLQTREQHIRRDKATSNICTNVGLVALRAAIYLAIMGKGGLRELARICLERACYAKEGIAALEGYELCYPDAPHFHEVALRLPRPPAEVTRALDARGITGGIDLGPAGHPRCMLLCFTEVTTPADIDRLVAALAEIGGAS